MNTPLFLGTIAGGGKGEFLGGINTPLYNSISLLIGRGSSSSNRKDKREATLST